MFATLRTFGHRISNDYMLCRVRGGNSRVFFITSLVKQVWFGDLYGRWSSQGALSSTVPFIL